MCALISEELLMQIAASVIFAINRKKERQRQREKEGGNLVKRHDLERREKHSKTNSSSYRLRADAALLLVAA